MKKRKERKNCTEKEATKFAKSVNSSAKPIVINIVEKCNN